MVKAWMRISIFVVVLTAIASLSSPAFSIDPDVNARLAPGADGQSVTLTTSVSIPSANSSSGTPGSNSASRVGPLRWSAQKTRYVDENSRFGIIVLQTVPCDPAQFVAPSGTYLTSLPANGTGTVYSGILSNRVTGVRVSTTIYCKAPRVPVTRPPASVSTPPTYGEIWNALYSTSFQNSARSSGAYVAPASPGLTGLPTNIWAQFPDGQTINRDVTLPNGYRLRATVRITQVQVLTTSPSGRRTTLVTLAPNGSGSIDGGSFENPAAVHVFSTVGNYQITTGVIWSGGNATLSGPGIGTISVPVGSIRLEINRAYVVNQLRPALTG
ncbi:MAG TPA: hypothetical protein PKB15_02365 [Acidimicrobiia bacterium]|nr:hypothetical protein [Acidimicrobiia bacterium]